jgi:[ribosomal protein S5]-alanine N-acetyltransferase
MKKRKPGLKRKGGGTAAAVVQLLPISADGKPAGFAGELPPEVGDVLAHTVALYERVGHVVPWISYLAAEGNKAVGICSFKSPPSDRQVEIAYFTFPQHEGRGIATQMAMQLIAIAQAQPDAPMVLAQTLPDRTASHRILEKLGFKLWGTVENPQDGLVFEWQLKR